MTLEQSIPSYFFSHQHTFAQCVVDSVEYAWQIPSMIEKHWEEIISHCPTLRLIGENIWAEEGAVIEDGAQIEGYLIVGRGSTIKKNTVIRGYNVIGRDVMIGNFVEIKNTLIYDGVQLPHLSYIGDSVLGYYSHLGAGVKVSNFKSWGNEINITFDDIKLFFEHVTDGKYIKAAGGIKSFEDAEKFIELGADRLGTSRLIKLMK